MPSVLEPNTLPPPNRLLSLCRALALLVEITEDQPPAPRPEQAPPAQSQGPRELTLEPGEHVFHHLYGPGIIIDVPASVSGGRVGTLFLGDSMVRFGLNHSLNPLQLPPKLVATLGNLWNGAYMMDIHEDGSASFFYNNGSGDSLTILFMEAGVVIFGLDHEFAASPWRTPSYNSEPRQWPTMHEGFPTELRPATWDPLFKNASFCIWRKQQDTEWRTGDLSYLDDLNGGRGSDGGSSWLLEIFEGPEAWQFKNCDLCQDCDAEGGDCDECDRCHIPIEPLRRLWNEEPLSEDLIQQLRPDAAAAEIVARARIAGYPVSC